MYKEKKGPQVTSAYVHTDGAHVAVMLCGHMLGQGNIGGEGPVSLGVTDAAGSGSNPLKVGVQMASRGAALRWGRDGSIVHIDAATPLWIVPKLA